MALVQHDDVVEHFLAHSADEALANPVLPWAPVAESNGKASRSCCATHAAVGNAVTAQRTTSRRPWRTTRNTCRTRNSAVGTEKKSMAAIPSRWFRKKDEQVGLALGVRGRVRR